MNQAVDSILSTATPLLAHDQSVIMKLAIAISALCALVVICTVWVVSRRRQLPHKQVQAMPTVALIMILAIPVTAITVTASAMQDHLLQSSGISISLRNENTNPPVVRIGSSVTVTTPLRLQSFFGYNEASSLKVKASTATLPSGETIPVSLAIINEGGGRKPDKFDFIPVMENVKLYLKATVPDDPKLSGAVIDLAVAGSLRLIPSTSKEPVATGDFDTTVRFRVARDKEVAFQAAYDSLSLQRYNLFSFLVAGFAFFGILFFSPWTCRQCGGRVSAFKIMGGHFCPECYKAAKNRSA